MPYVMKSQEDLETGSRQLLPSDEYVVRISEYEEKLNEPDQYNPGQTRDVIVFKMTPLSFADGSELEDTEGDPVVDKLLFAFIEPKRTGYSATGPSKARKFFSAAMGQMPDAELAIDSWDDLLGKTLIAAVGMSKDGKNNRVNDYRPVKVQRARKGATAKPAAPVEDDDNPDELPF
jgi:hypothetical protein